ncbi:hypothetical protein [Plantibacter flavus]|uniref:hypothetical protein n=1 Tax=Plantibacter flavus TaxID=150123 RepID=UPI001294865F|nr:hypothetical protein [Plantibacter flavus]
MTDAAHTNTATPFHVGFDSEGRPVQLGEGHTLVMSRSESDRTLFMWQLIAAALRRGDEVGVIDLADGATEYPGLARDLSFLATDAAAARDRLVEVIDRAKGPGRSPRGTGGRNLTIVVNDLEDIRFDIADVGAALGNDESATIRRARANAAYSLKRLVRCDRRRVRVIVGTSNFGRYQIEGALQRNLTQRLFVVPKGVEFVPDDAIERLNLSPCTARRALFRMQTPRRGVALLSRIDSEHVEALILSQDQGHETALDPG